MYKKVKFIVASFFLLTFFVLSEAYCNCGYFIVEFDNQTPFNCDVIKSKLIRGYWKTPLIKTIAPYTMSYYEAEQSSAYGPDAEVTLRCGNKDNGYYTFTVRNQQNFCSSAGGKQSNTVPSKDKDINVTNVVRQHAAYWAAKPGIARVTVSTITTDFTLRASKNLIVNGVPEPGKIVLSTIDSSAKWADYPSGTTYLKRNLHRYKGNGNLVSSSLMRIKSQGDKNSPILTTNVIIEQTSENCTFSSKENLISNAPAFIYKIIFERVGVGANANIEVIRPVEICTQHANKLTAIFSDPINNFLLPIEFISYDSDGNPGSGVRTYIPLA